MSKPTNTSRCTRVTARPGSLGGTTCLVALVVLVLSAPTPTLGSPAPAPGGSATTPGSPVAGSPTSGSSPARDSGSPVSGIVSGRTAENAYLGGGEAVVIGYDLRPQRIVMRSLRNGVLGYFGSDRQYRSEPVSRYLRIRLLYQSESIAAATPGLQELQVLELTDGQRLLGRFVGGFSGSAEIGQVLSWQHVQLGQVNVSLDRVRAIRPFGTAGDVTSSRTDRVTLANGDVLIGFVTDLADEALVMTIRGRAEPVVIAVDQLAGLELANPPTRSLQQDADMLHFVDGSRVLAKAVTIEPDGLSFVPVQWSKQKVFELPADWLVRIDPAATDVELVDLASVASTVVAGGKVFGLAWPPRIEGSDILLHAPIEVRYELPRGAQRFATKATLDVEPGDPVEWSSFTVAIVMDGRDVASFHITAEQPTASINLPVNDTTLAIRLEPGANGPVMDRLRLVEPVILVGPAQLSAD